jgi:xylulokinase
MASEYLLGLDIGTFESKGVIASQDGRVVARASLPHELSLPSPGWAEHDADKVWWHDFTGLVTQLLTSGRVSASDIAGVGCSGIGPDLLPVGRAVDRVLQCFLRDLDLSRG